MDISIQKAEPKHLNEILSLSHSIWRSHFHEFLSDGQIEYMLRTMYNLRNLKKEMLELGYHYRLVYVNEQLAGYFSYLIERNSSGIKLSKIYLKSEYQDRSIGQIVFEYIKNVAIDKQVNQIYLQVNKRNFMAIKSYKKAGFEVIQSLTTDIGNGFIMDDYVMALKI